MDFFKPQVTDCSVLKPSVFNMETNSIWDNLGKCIEGKYKGISLQPVIHGQHFAFAWFEFYPSTELFEY
mgnify:CR=1 FL=1